MPHYNLKIITDNTDLQFAFNLACQNFLQNTSFWRHEDISGQDAEILDLYDQSNDSIIGKIMNIKLAGHIDNHQLKKVFNFYNLYEDQRLDNTNKAGTATTTIEFTADL